VPLHLLAEGLTAAAIGRRLTIAPRTVTKHLEHVYAKLHTSDRLSAVLRAQRLGLLPRPASGAFSWNSLDDSAEPRLGQTVRTR
jgi:hypothetical protein